MFRKFHGVMLPVMQMLVGRDRELAQLERALADAAAGHGRLVLLAGEPGIGKSRLADEAARRSGMRVLWGRCWEAGGAPPFWPWIQVLRAIARDVAVAAPVELSRLLPELGASTAAKQPVADERFLLYDAIHRYLGAAANERPLLIVLEDLHAADAASLRVLAFVASHLRGSAVAVIGTYRTSEARTTPEVGDLIVKLGRDAETIVPKPLSRADIAALAADANISSDSIIDAIDRTSEGNPLFARELVKLSERGPFAIPDTVRAAIREHLQRVPAEARAVADCAAVIGNDVDRVMLEQLAERGSALAADVGALIDHGILVELAPGRLGYAHGLFAETLHHDLAPAQRERLHARAAELLPSSSTGAELTRHLFAAGPAYVPQAIAAARRAANEAARQLAFDEASLLLEQAMAAAPRDDRELHFELALALGAMQIHAGNPKAGKATCLRAAEVARELGGEARFARAVSTYGQAINPGFTDHVLIGLLEEALDKLAPGDTPERARLLARLASARQPSIDPRVPVEIALAAIAMARRLGDLRTMLEVLFTAVSALVNFGPPHERLAINNEVLELATRFDEPTIILRTHYRLVLDHLVFGDVASATRHQRTYDRLARDMRQPQVRAFAAQLRSLFALHAGRIAEAAADEAEAIRAFAEEHDIWHRGFRVATLIALGDDASIASNSAAFVEMLAAAFPMYYGMGKAAFAAFSGDLERARAGLAQLSPQDVLRFRDYQNLSWLATTVARLGDRAWAQALYDGLAGDDSLWCGSGIPLLAIEPPVSRVRGVLASVLDRPDDTRKHFAEALAALRLANTPVLLARTLVEWADTKAATPDDALAALSEARSIATTLGLPLIARIEACERRRGASGASLTIERDGDVWRLAFAGAVHRIKHNRGIELVARLVAEPTREVHALELAGSELADGGDAGEVLDREAIAAYRARVAELREELDEAESFHDPGRQARATAELEALQEQLAAGVGLGNRQRRSGAANERARVNVQRRIADAIKKISELSPQLGHHLETSIRTGMVCSYDPRRNAVTRPPAGRP